MIIKEFLRKRNDGINLYKIYSDQENTLVKKIGTEEKYEFSIDVENAPFEYEEYLDPEYFETKKRLITESMQREALKRNEEMEGFSDFSLRRPVVETEPEVEEEIEEEIIEDEKISEEEMLEILKGVI